MIEVVFSSGAKGSLMQGKPEGRKDIYAFELALSVGDISEDIPAIKRQMVLEDLLTAALPGDKPMAARSVSEARENLHQILTRWGQGEDLRIWTSDCPDDRCGMVWLLAQLDGLKNRGKVWLVALPEWVDRGDNTLVQYRGWGEVEPGDWMKFSACQQEAPAILLRACRHQWKMLQEENAPLRAVVNGTLMSVPETFYDHVLQWALSRQPEEFSVGHLLAETLHKQMGVGDGWFALRTEKLIQEGVLTVVKEAPPDDIRYRRIVRKT